MPPVDVVRPEPPPPPAPPEKPENTNPPTVQADPAANRFDDAVNRARNGQGPNGKPEQTDPLQTILTAGIVQQPRTTPAGTQVPDSGGLPNLMLPPSMRVGANGQPAQTRPPEITLVDNPTDPPPSEGDLGDLLLPTTQPQEPVVPPAKGDKGRTEVPGAGTDLRTIARENEVTLRELEAANPHLFTPEGDPRPLGPDDTVIVLDRERSVIAAGTNGRYEDLSPKEKAALKNEGALPTANGANENAAAAVAGVSTEMLYATQDDAVPGDALERLTQEMKARRPGDEVWAAVVDRAADRASGIWSAQGRTHAVMDPLYRFANQQVHAPTDFLSLQGTLGDQLTTLAQTEPTREAIQRHIDMLLQFGPQDPTTQQMIRSAGHEFLVAGPERAAAEIENAYTEGEAEGPLRASQKLADLTDPTKVDPLTAALILEKAGPTVEKITTEFPEIFAGGHTIYKNLSAAAESAFRSPVGKPLVESLARDLPVQPGQVDAQWAAAEGSGVTLSLAIARQHRLNGDEQAATAIEQQVLDGVGELEQRARDLSTELGLAAAPLVDPPMTWDAFVPEDRMPGEGWFTDSEVLADIEAKFGEMNIVGGQLMRAYGGTAAYAPQLEGSPFQGALLGKAPPLAGEDPHLSLVLRSSRDGLLEGSRMTNLEGLRTGDLGTPNIVIDPSWTARMLRNNPQSFIAAHGNRAPPMGIGLSLFGAGTYGAGISFKAGDDRGRSPITAGIYAGGVLTEGTHLAAQLARHWGLSSSETGVIRNIAARQGAFGKLFKWHLQTLGWWNVLGSVQAGAQGEGLRALFHGAAGGGTLVSTSTAIENALKARWGASVPKWVKFGGTTATLLSTVGLMVLDHFDKREIFGPLEDAQTRFLTEAGIDEDVARALSVHNEEGGTVAARLAALARHRGITPEQLLTYLNGQDPDEVERLAGVAVQIPPDENGEYPSLTPQELENFDLSRPLIPRVSGDAYGTARNINELNEIVDIYFPDFPGTST